MRISVEVANQNVDSPGLPGCTLESPRNAGIRAQANERPVCVGESSCPATTRPAETKNAISAGSASAVHLNSTWGNSVVCSIAAVGAGADRGDAAHHAVAPDRKSTRLNSSHSQISYAVFCLKKKNKLDEPIAR